MLYLKFLAISILASLVIACSKSPIPEYVGVWVDSKNADLYQRIITITKNGEHYIVKDELINQETKNVSASSKSDGEINRAGELQYGEYDMVNKISLDESTSQLIINTYDDNRLLFEKE